MRTLPTFAVQVRRLAELRGIGVSSLARRAAVPEPLITAVLDGTEPGPSLLRRLARALGLHAGDLFVIAGRPVPHDLAPLDPAAADGIASLSWSLTYLPRAVRELHQLVRSLPQQPRPEPSSAPRYQQYPNNPDDLGALTGIDLADDRPPVHPDAAEVAQLIWNARRLTVGQLQEVRYRAHAIRHERADELSPDRRCTCPGRPSLAT
ncbi:multiprotein-bridging factor 1 family protein [Micromonospora aurantiaca]|uniref:helix-turn-helix domain-containing protein n=1 Tax=Micromonospora aurantiaca (nom. illeg.) TaxID=47850 RepID=UPI0037AA6F80